MHARRQLAGMARPPAALDIAYPPFDLAPGNADEIEEMAVPDRAAGQPVVHADPPADQTGGRCHRPVLADVKVAGGEIAQRKHRQPDMAMVALVDAPQMRR